jgi:hypothetical protein
MTGLEANAHLTPVFDLMFPTIATSGVEYFVYVGVGVAGALGRFI